MRSHTPLRSLPIVVLVIALFSIASAGCGGTGTGNPGGTASSNSNPTARTSAASVLNAACTKLTACFPSLTASQCNTGLLAQTNLAATLGLAANFGTYQAIIDAETTGSITPHSSASSNCVSDLAALACSSTAVQTAYSASAPADFSQAFNLIPTSTSSCKGLY